MLTGDEIRSRCEAAGCQRVVIADFRVDESDSYSDYHGGRTVRTVVIGFGKGLRENFKQLRKAAATFEPTRHLGPGRDQYYIWVNREEETPHGYTPATREGGVFETQEAAEEWIQSEIAKVEPGADYSQAGICAKHYGYRIAKESIENRENYSMGGGNYLGHDRYGGWRVSSLRVDWSIGNIEFFEPPKPRTKQRKRKPDTRNRTPEPVATDYTDWL